MSLGRYYRRIVVVPQGLFDPDRVNVIEISSELRDEPVVIAATTTQFQIGDSIISVDSEKELITHKYSDDCNKISRPKTADAYVDHKVEVKEAETYVRTSGRRVKRRNEQSQTLSKRRAVREWLNCMSSDDNELVVDTVSQINNIVLGDADSSSCSEFLSPYDIEIVLSSCMSNMNLPIGEEDTSDVQDIIPMQQVLSRITEASEYTAASSPRNGHIFETTPCTTCRSSTTKLTRITVESDMPSNASCEVDPVTSAHKRSKHVSSPAIIADESSSKEVLFDTEDRQTTTDLAAQRSSSSESFATTADSLGHTKTIIEVCSGQNTLTETQGAMQEKICCPQKISSDHVKEVRCDIELYLKEVENVEIKQLNRDLANYQLARRRCFLGCQYRKCDELNDIKSNSR